MTVKYIEYKMYGKRTFRFLQSKKFEKDSFQVKQDVFFHFSKIKDEKVREELEKLKRGTVYIFYTSHVENNKRKVSRMWLEVLKMFLII